MRPYLFALFFVLACSPKPPDVFVFENMTQRLSTDPATGHLMLTASPTCMERIKEPECGHGVSIVSGAEVFIGEAKGTWFGGKPWSQVKRESVYVPAVESYAPLATYIINSCKKMGCSADVDKFKVKLDSLNGISGAINNP
jgi:hypothetical protein